MNSTLTNGTVRVIVKRKYGHFYNCKTGSYLADLRAIKFREVRE